MLKTIFLDQEFCYDGNQLKSLFAYMKTGALGDSVVSWVGPCEVSPTHMMDGEDLRAGAEIKGDKMLHFIFEIFDRELASGVFLQRLFAATCREWIEENARVRLFRDGDDLYWDQKKFSISIAVKAATSTLVHFAVNVTNEGTPVKTCALGDWKVEPRIMAEGVMHRIAHEYTNIIEATRKVRAVGSV